MAQGSMAVTSLMTIFETFEFEPRGGLDLRYHDPCRFRIRHQAAAGSWTMPRQWEIQRTWLNSARAAVRSPAKPNGV